MLMGKQYRLKTHIRRKAQQKSKSFSQCQRPNLLLSIANSFKRVFAVVFSILSTKSHKILSSKREASIGDRSKDNVYLSNSKISTTKGYRRTTRQSNKGVQRSLCLSLPTFPLQLSDYLPFPYLYNIMFIFRRCVRLCPANFYQVATAKPKKEKTFYQILQVPTTATPTSIKKNYLKLAKIYHPDVYKGADKNRFQKIQQAYKTLSNQSDRSKYDETIGIRSTYEADPVDGQGQGTSKGETYGKSANDFTYSKPKVEINIDEEYEKFFKKKSTTNFEEIRMHEQTEFKGMSEKERIRRRFTEVYTDPKLDWKMQYSKSYPEILDDQIQQKNKYEQELKRKEEEHAKKYNEQGIKRQAMLIKVGAGLSFLILLPFLVSFKTKLQLQREAKECYEKKVNEIFQEMQSEQVKKRLRFD